MNSHSIDARPGNAPDLSDLDPSPRIGAQAVCKEGDYVGPTVFVSPDRVNQALLQGQAEHPVPGHTITVADVPLR